MIKFIILLLLISCQDNVPVSSTVTANNYKVELLFEHDGCRVYRFYDSRSVYFTNCDEATWVDTHPCGKSVCTHNVQNKTVRGDK